MTRPHREFKDNLTERKKSLGSMPLLTSCAIRVSRLLSDDFESGSVCAYS
jgi:hypothetical protein